MTEKCKRCGRAKHMGRCKKAAVEASGATKATGATFSGSVTATTEAPPTVTISRGLEVEPCLGFRASIESGTLCLEQDRPDAEDGKVYTHSLQLSPHEARKLVDWVASFVEDEAA